MASLLILVLLQLRPAETVPFTTLSGSSSAGCALVLRMSHHTDTWTHCSLVYLCRYAVHRVFSAVLAYHGLRSTTCIVAGCRCLSSF